MKRIFGVGTRSVVIDDDVAYMDVDVVSTDEMRVSSETWCAIIDCSDAIDLMCGVVKRGLPLGRQHLPVEDGPFADAARLDGRWRELMDARCA